MNKAELFMEVRTSLMQEMDRNVDNYKNNRISYDAAYGNIRVIGDEFEKFLMNCIAYLHIDATEIEVDEVIKIFKSQAVQKLEDVIDAKRVRIANMTKQEAIQHHRHMWNWIANRIIETEAPLPVSLLKEEYMDEHGFKDVAINWFACEYALEESKRQKDSGSACKYCPIDWDVECNLACFNREGLYAQVLKYNPKGDYREQAKLCKRIAELSERM